MALLLAPWMLLATAGAVPASGDTKVGPVVGSDKSTNPHVPCEFWFEVSGFPTTPDPHDAVLTITTQSPTTGPVGVATAIGSSGASNVVINGNMVSFRFTGGGPGSVLDGHLALKLDLGGAVSNSDAALDQQGYKVDLDLAIDGQKQTGKNKIAWVQPCTPPLTTLQALDGAGSCPVAPSTAYTYVLGNPNSTALAVSIAAGAATVVPTALTVPANASKNTSTAANTFTVSTTAAPTVTVTAVPAGYKDATPSVLVKTLAVPTGCGAQLTTLQALDGSGSCPVTGSSLYTYAVSNPNGTPLAVSIAATGATVTPATLTLPANASKSTPTAANTFTVSTAAAPTLIVTAVPAGYQDATPSVLVKTLTVPTGCGSYVPLPDPAQPAVTAANDCVKGITVTMRNLASGYAYGVSFEVKPSKGSAEQHVVGAGGVVTRSYAVDEDTTGTVTVSAPGLAGSPVTFTYAKNCEVPVVIPTPVVTPTEIPVVIPDEIVPSVLPTSITRKPSPTVTPTVPPSITPSVLPTSHERGDGLPFTGATGLGLLLLLGTGATAVGLTLRVAGGRAAHR